MSHAEKIQKIIDRMRHSLIGYGFPSIQVEDIIYIVSIILSEEME